MLSFNETIVSNFEGKLKSLGVFFDLSRAFDTINHQLLLDKLHNYGIRGAAWCWVQSYLAGRTQYVRVSQKGQKFMSSSVNVETGVPQGSILGPFLIVIFINDLVKFVNNAFLTLYADDTSGALTATDFNILSTKADLVLKKCQTGAKPMDLYSTQAKPTLSCLLQLE